MPPRVADEQTQSSPGGAPRQHPAPPVVGEARAIRSGHCRPLKPRNAAGAKRIGEKAHDPIRQFREEVPAFREVDLHQRAVRILARLRGMPPPTPHEHWDDGAAAGLAEPAEVDAVVDTYSRVFVETMPPVEGAGELLAGLAGRGFRLAILSNWPLAATIDRYVAGAGWDGHLAGIFVSQRIGTIKPHPAIFAFAADALGTPPGAILHVGDDWAADVVGAREAGWRVAWLRGQQRDTPLPTSARSGHLVPDLELDDLTDLASRVADPTA